jgi:hypothetical protein
MKKNNKNYKQSWLRQIPKEVFVALITGVCGFIGIATTAYFGYISVWIPIKATQIAVASLPSTNTQVSSPITSPTPQTPSSTPQASSSTSNNYAVVAELIPGSGCYGQQLPDNLDPVGDPQGTVEKVSQGSSDGSILNWAYPARVNEEFIVIYTISNIAPTGGEIIVENKAKAVVEYEPSQEHANIMPGACGGGEWNYLFTPVYLNDKMGNSASLTTHSEKYDYFSIQQGENERFELPFVCEQPGLYKTTLIFQYSFMGKTYEAKTGQTKILCLNNYTEWEINIVAKEIFKRSEYVFTENQYEMKP